MRRLVALELEAGPHFVTELQRAFDDGDAVLPIDPRLPEPARCRLRTALKPEVVVGDDGERRLLRGGEPVEEGDAFVVATSGTTGEPRGVVLTHDAVAASARATSSRLGVDPGRDRWCCCLPPAHVGGLSVITRALVSGTRLEVLPGFDAAGVLAAARQRGATLVSLVPTTLRRLGPDGAATFRTIVLGGSAPPRALPPNVVTTYGMTETGSGVVYDGLPLEGVEVRIVAGEVVLRGPMLLRAYRDGTSPLDGDGWLATGDAGRIGADGHLEVLGRLRELIITGGENVWPAAVEAVLARHPAVGEVAVAGRPDPEWGERVVAFVVVRRPDGPAGEGGAPLAPPALEGGGPPAAPGGEGGAAAAPALAELRELVAAELGAFAAPKELVVVDSLPRTAIGKLRRAELARLDLTS